MINRKKYTAAVAHNTPSQQIKKIQLYCLLNELNILLYCVCFVSYKLIMRKWENLICILLNSIIFISTFSICQLSGFVYFALWVFGNFWHRRHWTEWNCNKYQWNLDAYVLLSVKKVRLKRLSYTGSLTSLKICGQILNVCVQDSLKIS